MKTLAGSCRYEESIRKSRFIAHAAPVKSQAETLQFYESVIDPGATHNCWAWTINHVHRSNDDGEPSGSAGRPILATIDGRDLDQVMIVVTRYFGGIKLGIGGLVRAYGGCAAKCLDRARVVEWQPTVECELQFDFALSGAIHALLEQHGIQKQSESFEASGARMVILIEERQFEALGIALANVSRGQAVLRKVGVRR